MLRERIDHIIELGANSDVCIADFVVGRASDAPLAQSLLELLGSD